MRALGTRAAVLALAAAALQACATNPVTGRSELSLVSEQEEIAIGVQSRPEVLAQYDSLYRDARLQAYVTEVGMAVARVGHRPGLPYSFEVLSSSEINAFALPGGKIFITRGLLVRLSNEAQLAGVLGHEVGHVTAKHAVRGFSNAILLQIPLLVGASYAQMKGKGEYLVALGAVGAGLMQLRFSRRHESESDRLGIEYSAKAGYNPEGMVQLLEVLSEAQPSEPSKFEGWFLSHPLTSSRIDEARGLIVRGYPQLETMNLAWHPERFADAMSTLRYEQPGYDSFDLAERARAEGRYTDAIQLYGRAIAHVPAEGLFHAGRGLAYAELGSTANARTDLHKAVQLSPGLYAAHLGLGLAELQAGNAAAAAHALSSSAELLPTAPQPYFFLGQLAERQGNGSAAADYYRLAGELSQGDSDVRSAALAGLGRVGR
jgi:beta-barrel assembly-enhancing protease